MTAAAEPLRRRLSLTQPQATESTTVLEWAPEGPGEPRGGAPVDRAGGWRPPSATWVLVLFVQGDRDALCDLDLLERERRARLGQVATRLHVLDGADHGFRVRGRDRGQVLDEVAGVVAGWLEGLA
jgi:hypothetical protein